MFVPGAVSSASSWPSSDMCVSSLLLSSKPTPKRFLGGIGEFGSSLVFCDAVLGERGPLDALECSVLVGVGIS